jgi:hypothetical protein
VGSSYTKIILRKRWKQVSFGIIFRFTCMFCNLHTAQYHELFYTNVVPPTKGLFPIGCCVHNYRPGFFQGLSDVRRLLIWKMLNQGSYIKKDFNNILVNKNSIALNMFTLFQADPDKDSILILYHTTSLQLDLVTIPIFKFELALCWTWNMFCRRLDLLNLELFIKKI